MSLFREVVQKQLIDVVKKKRSPKWRKVRKQHIKNNPECFACGSKRKLEVHHIKDFSSNPELELDPNNLVTLCSAGCECHLTFGHLGSFRSINPDVIADCNWFREKVENRR